MLILGGIFLALAIVAWFKSWRLMQSDAKGSDAVAIYAAAVALKEVAAALIVLAAIATVIHVL